MLIFYAFSPKMIEENHTSLYIILGESILIFCLFAKNGGSYVSWKTERNKNLK